MSQPDLTHVTPNKRERIQLTPTERKSSSLLALLFATRMLGLFLLTPIFAVAAQALPGGNDAAKVGFALGAYGLTQAIMQIPLGMASDRFGRRPIIIGGMLLFIIGGVVCALAESVDGIIVGRTLQGLGAVSAAITAWVADATRPEVRARAMAMVGASIGLSFAVSLVLSPVLVGEFGLSGLFWVISLLGFICLLLAAFVVPAAPKSNEAIIQATVKEVLQHKDLLRLNFGVFSLHFVLMMLFIVVPGVLAQVGGLGSASLWKVYLPVMLVSFVFMVPAVIFTETRKRHKGVMEVMILLLVLVLGFMPLAMSALWSMVVALLLFFIGFNVLEALQPSYVSRVAPANFKGLALGFYNMTQSLGVFGGGVVGGLVLQYGSPSLVMVVGSGLTLIWFFSTRRLQAQL